MTATGLDEARTVPETQHEQPLLAVEANPIFSAGEQENPSAELQKRLWLVAGKKVKMALLVAGGFTTLRDRTGINEIKLEQLRTINKLGTFLSV